MEMNRTVINKCNVEECFNEKVYYSAMLNIAVCLNCKINNYSQFEFDKIEDRTDAQKEIKNIFNWLKIMKEQIDYYDLDSIYKGTYDSLLYFEEKIEEIQNELNNASRHMKNEKFVAIRK